MTLQKETGALFNFKDYFKDTLRKGRAGPVWTVFLRQGTAPRGPVTLTVITISFLFFPTQNKYRKVQEVVTYLGVGFNLFDESSPSDRTESNTPPSVTVQRAALAIWVPPNPAGSSALMSRRKRTSKEGRNGAKCWGEDTEPSLVQQ